VMLNAALGPILITMLLRLADDQPMRRSDLGWGALAWACFFLPSVTLAVLVGPELPTLGGALVGSIVFVTLLRWRRKGGASGTGLTRAHLADLAPYLGVLILVLATRMIPTLRAALSAISIDWELPGSFAGSFQPLYHPGTILAVGLVVGALATGRIKHLPLAAAAALHKLAPVGMALLAMLAMARLMVHSGMIDTLAAEASRTGALWPLFAPSIGGLGTFVTGSATASNILFSEFQLTTATALSLPAPVMLAAQGFGAALSNLIAPHNIIAGSATVGLKGMEGDILAWTIVPCAYCVAAGSAILLAIVSFG